MSLAKKPIDEYLGQESNMVTHRNNLIDLARVAENAERFEDMCKAVRAMVELDTKTADPTQPTILNTEERNLLSVAYKHVISSRRTSWRTLNSDEGRSNDFVAEYRSQLEQELEEVCKEVLDLLEHHLIPAQRRAIDRCEQELSKLPIITPDPNPPPNAPPSPAAEAVDLCMNSLINHKEGLVFYLKLCGDYYRYLAEFQPKGSGSHDNAQRFYDESYSLSKSRSTSRSTTPVLPTTNPVRLGLALNYSVCHYEILDQKEQACALADEAFKAALAKLDDLDEHAYKDSTLILMLLRDNLTLWSENTPKDQQTYEQHVGPGL